MLLDDAAARSDNQPTMEAIVIDEGLDFVEDISRRLVVQVAKDSPSRGENRLRWDGQCARGAASCAKVRPGLNLMLTDVESSMPWSFDVLHQPTGLEFCFAKSSGVQVFDEHGANVGLQAGKFGVMQVKEPTRMTCQADTSREQSVRVAFDADELCRLFELEDLPAEIADVLSQHTALAAHCQNMTTAMFNVVDELTRCGMTGPMRQLFLEGKSLELVALALEALNAVSPPMEGELDSSTVERLEHARSLLLARICEPPSLRELARACGLNERKLKEGFKQRFGITVFGFVRQQRMLRAHDLLSGSGRSVTEVAQSVGYANASKFAAAFRRQFGVPPSVVAFS